MPATLTRALFALALTTAARAAEPAKPAPGHSLHGEAFDEGPRRAAYLKEGMGLVDFAVTTESTEARAFVNQGVAQLHSFYYFEAERSFRQAAKLDPSCALAYWGMAMANVNNDGRARKFLKEARDRDAKLTPREKLYLDALEALYTEGGDAKGRKQAHLRGWEAIVQEHPGDLDARAWLAMVAWQEFETGSRQAIEGLIEGVERANPKHPGAHHYRIHLWDGTKPALALHSAATYASTAPGIAHAWHMPGHTYTALKRYADAADQQEGSARVDHAAMLRDRVLPFEIHNYAHNNQWLAATLGNLGRARDAAAVARDLVEQPRDPQKNTKDDAGSAQRSGRLRWAETLARFELWDDLIAATTSGALDWSDAPEERRQRAYSLGLAYAAKGDKAKLAEQIAALRGLADPKTPADAKPAAPSGSIYALEPADARAALAELEGHRELLNGKAGAAFERFTRATFMRPEALARAHLVARNFGLAESAALRAVEAHPDEVPALAALVEVLLAVGKEAEARAAYKKLLPMARGADRDLPGFRRLGSAVARWQEDAPPPPPADATPPRRVDLAALGPLTWQPWPAEPFAKSDTDGRPWSLADHRGRNVLLVLYLGEQCPHCLQQLRAVGKEIAAFQKLGTDVVAVGTDGPAETKALKANAAGVAFPMPLLADPDQEVFRAYHARDDFEDRPLHGVFLIDARGAVRFRRVSAEPFLDVAFLLGEAARLGRLKP